MESAKFNKDDFEDNEPPIGGLPASLSERARYGLLEVCNVWRETGTYNLTIAQAEIVSGRILGIAHLLEQWEDSDGVMEAASLFFDHPYKRPKDLVQVVEVILRNAERASED